MRNKVRGRLTLSGEIKEVSLKSSFFKGALLLAASILMAVLYVWFFTSVLGFDLPKVAFLKAERSRWVSRMEIMNTRLDHCQQALDAFQMRDEEIYRSVFGLDEIPSSVRNSVSTWEGRYGFPEDCQPDALLSRTLLRLDSLSRRACVQSLSFNEISSVSAKAGDMASCIPAVPPVIPDPSIYQLSSVFGGRADPFTGEYRSHTGVDLAMRIGNPVFATGDGVVETVAFEFFGYGNCVVINHGFGYKTMYAHLNSVNVIEGMKVKRGEKIAVSGKSGRASGAHLHYEVIYRGERVNPENYFDLSMSEDEYLAMVTERANESGRGTARHGFRVYRR